MRLNRLVLFIFIAATLTVSVFLIKSHKSRSLDESHIDAGPVQAATQSNTNDKISDENESKSSSSSVDDLIYSQPQENHNDTTTISRNIVLSSDKVAENTLPNGRYRNLVFSEDQIGSTKDITFKTRYDTKLIKNSDTDYDLIDDTNSLVDLKLNMYYPLNDPLGKRPLIIFVYGGGWIEGDRYQREADAIYFARMGYVTMTMEYTMLPPGNEMNPVPSEDSSVYVKLVYESASDLYSAYRYAIAHKSTYDIDASRIGIGGWSAGGMLSQALTHAASLPKPYGLKATLGLSNILPSALMNLYELNGGFKIFSSNYKPVSMFASYDDDTGFAGTANDHAADCAYLQSIQHRCITVTYPGSGHLLDFSLTPAVDNAVPFFAQYLAGY
jgi:acetyl esterase/lipase